MHILVYKIGLEGNFMWGTQNFPSKNLCPSPTPNFPSLIMEGIFCAPFPRVRCILCSIKAHCEGILKTQLQRFRKSNGLMYLMPEMVSRGVCVGAKEQSFNNS